MHTPPASSRQDHGASLFSPVGSPLAVTEVSPACRAAEIERAIDACWARHQARNPRLFDGAIWSVQSFDPAGGRLTCARDRYAALVCQPEVPAGVCLLAVTGIVRRNRAGACEVLLARRGKGVFAYPGLWELAPAGGVECRREGPPDEAWLRSQVLHEGREEFDLPPGETPFAAGRVAAMVHDRTTSSLDVVLWCAASPALAQRLESPLAGWECDAARWVTRDEAAMWLAREPETLIPPTRLLLHEVAWADQ